MAIRSLIHDFWLAGIGLQCVLVAVLMLRNTWKKLPFFTAYMFVNLLEAFIILSISTKGMTYFYTYWIFEAVTTVLGLAVVFEIFTALLTTHPALRQLATTIFRVALVGLILLGLIIILKQTRTEYIGLGSAILVVAEAARMVELGLLVFLFLFSSVFGLHWRTHIFGVALGLGIFVALSLTILSLRSEFGSGVTAALNLAGTLGFDLSLLIWTTYLFMPERVMKTDEVPKRAQLEQWNQAVMELINR